MVLDGFKGIEENVTEQKDYFQQKESQRNENFGVFGKAEYIANLHF